MDIEDLNGYNGVKKRRGQQAVMSIKEAWFARPVNV